MPLHLKQKRIRAFLHFKCFLKGGNCPYAFFEAQKTHSRCVVPCSHTHPGISPFQMLLEGWELPRCVFRGSKNAFQMRCSKCFSKGGNCPDAFFRAQKTHPGISPFQMLLEGWELPRCIFPGSKNASGHFSILNAS